MKKLQKSIKFSALILPIIATAFLGGITYFNVGMRDLKNFRGPGNYNLSLSPGKYNAYAFYKWKSEGLYNEDINHCTFKILDKFKNEVVSYDSGTDNGSIEVIFESNGRKGKLLKSFEIKKKASYLVSISSNDMKPFVLTIFPLPDEFPSNIFRYINIVIELEKNRFE